MVDKVITNVTNCNSLNCVESMVMKIALLMVLNNTA